MLLTLLLTRLKNVPKNKNVFWPPKHEFSRQKWRFSEIYFIISMDLLLKFCYWLNFKNLNNNIIFYLWDEGQKERMKKIMWFGKMNFLIVSSIICDYYHLILNIMSVTSPYNVNMVRMNCVFGSILVKKHQKTPK